MLFVPHRKQQADGECLLACVEMVLAYYAISVSRQQLFRQLRIITGFGTAISNAAWLKAPGIQCQVRIGRVEDLQAYINAGVPPILAIDTSSLPYWSESTQHAVVLVGLEGEVAYVNDPMFAQSPIQMPTAALWLAWEDMAVIMLSSNAQIYDTAYPKQ